jgi:Flp pilus assembly protein TadD
MMKSWAAVMSCARSVPVLASFALLAAAAPAPAETTRELDALSQATDEPLTGIALARRQIGEDELLEAMATLERVLMKDPDNLEARALHAGLLCRIDDRRGAILEFDALRGLDVPQPVSAEARRPCQGGG